jgi:type VI secretion system protein ImpG
MAELTPSERLQPCLLDRLTDDEPDARRREPGSAGVHLAPGARGGAARSQLAAQHRHNGSAHDERSRRSRGLYERPQLRRPRSHRRHRRRARRRRSREGSRPRHPRVRAPHHAGDAPDQSRRSTRARCRATPSSSRSGATCGPSPSPSPLYEDRGRSRDRAVCCGGGRRAADTRPGPRHAMDQKLVRYYERELRHVRETAAEFARDYPKIAGRLALDEFECADPYVERLLEGFAFLTARVQLKLDAEFPRFTQHLLESVYPHYLCPTPSMCVVQIRPTSRTRASPRGSPSPRHGAAQHDRPSDQSACEYRTAHDVTLAPIELVEAQYHDRDLLSLDLPPGQAPRRGRSACAPRLRGADVFEEIEIDALAIHPPRRGRTSRPGSTSRSSPTRPTSSSAPRSARQRGPSASIRSQPAPDGLRRQRGAAPGRPAAFQGYRHLQEYFAFPQRFRFAELTGSAARSRMRRPSIEIDFLLLARAIRTRAGRRRVLVRPALHAGDQPVPEAVPTASMSRTGSTSSTSSPTRPARSTTRSTTLSRSPGSGGSVDDERVVPPVLQGQRRRGHRGRRRVLRDRPQAPPIGRPRTPRRVAARATPGARSTSNSSTPRARPTGPTSVNSRSAPRCTNRDLPLRMPVGQGRTDFSMDIGGSVESIRCVTGPTPPRPSFVEGEILWRLISHLSLNYLSLADADLALGSDPATRAGQSRRRRDARPPQNLRPPRRGHRPASRSRASAASADARHAARPGAGPVSFARGLAVDIDFEEGYFEGTGCFVLGAVLERFFAKYVSVNSFTETVVHTRERGEIMRWPTRIGTRHTL